MDRFVRIGFTILLEAIEDTKAREAMRGAFLKLFKAILRVYGDDEAFKHAVVLHYGGLE